MRPVIRRKVLQIIQYWTGATKKTVRLKIAGESLSPIEQVLIDGVFRQMRNEAAEQLEIDFEWSETEKAPRVIELGPEVRIPADDDR